MRSILVSLLLLAWGGSVAATELNRIVLRVNDRITTLHDFELRRAERVLQVQRADLTPEDRREILAELDESILRQMYEEMLLLSRADQLGFRASDQDVERNFRETVDSLGIQNEEELAQALAVSGLTEETLRAQISRGMIMQDVIAREVRPRVTLEEEEMRRYYRDHREDFQAPERWQVQDAVVLASRDAAGDRAEAIAAQIVTRIESGESLAEAVQDQVELGNVTMIDLGWVARGDLESNLEAALSGLGQGEVSEPVEGRGGLHVLRVEAYEEPRIRTFPEVEEQIEAILQKDRFANEMGAYLEELAASAFVATDPPPGAEGFELDLGREVLAEDGLVDGDPRYDGQADADRGIDTATPGEVPDAGAETSDPGSDS